MAHSYYHAKSSVKTFGGDIQDYIEIHRFMDSSKAHIADARHRAILHSSFGIFIVEKIFGEVIKNSAGKEVMTRIIAEQHILEDFGFIPSVQQWLENMPLEKWHSQGAKALSRDKSLNVLQPDRTPVVQQADSSTADKLLEDDQMPRERCQPRSEIKFEQMQDAENPCKSVDFETAKSLVEIKPTDENVDQYTDIIRDGNATMPAMPDQKELDSLADSLAGTNWQFKPSQSGNVVCHQRIDMHEVLEIADKFRKQPIAKKLMQTIKEYCPDAICINFEGENEYNDEGYDYNLTEVTIQRRDKRDEKLDRGHETITYGSYDEDMADRFEKFAEGYADQDELKILLGDRFGCVIVEDLRALANYEPPILHKEVELADAQRFMMETK